eukprot:gene12550-8972_t
MIHRSCGDTRKRATAPSAAANRERLNLKTGTRDTPDAPLLRAAEDGGTARYGSTATARRSGRSTPTAR